MSTTMLIFALLVANVAAFIMVPVEGIDTTTCAGFADFPQPALIEYLGDNPFPDAWLGYPEPDEQPQWGTQHGFINDTNPNDKDTILWITAPTIEGTLGGIQLMIDWSHYDDAWLFIYAGLEPHAAADGRWYGSHPCGAYYLTFEQAIDLWMVWYEDSLNE